MKQNNLLSFNQDWAGLNFACGAVKRGGNWNDGANAGPFAVNLNNAPTDTNTNIGFRCCNSLQSQIFCLYEDTKQCKKTTSIQIQACRYKPDELNIKKSVFAVSKAYFSNIENCKNNINQIFVIKKEMITHKNLFQKVVGLGNIYAAYLKARKGKRNKKEVLEFEYNLENNLLGIQNDLINGKYEVGKYYKFVIFEPKKRIIYALPFRDRIVQHAICNIIESIFEKIFIHDSYACRKNKGTHKGIERLRYFLRKKEFYVLKCDIKKYFPSIDKETLKEIIRKKIADEKLLSLIDKIIDSGEYGLPIGNLTSQLFANLYLNELDYFVKNNLKAEFYLRYMDDFIILDESKKELHLIKKKIILFLISLKLEMHEKQAGIFPSEMGINFLGYIIYKDYMKARKSTVKRFLRRIKVKIKKYSEESLCFEKIMESFNSWNAYMVYGDTYLLRNKLKQGFKNVM